MSDLILPAATTTPAKTPLQQLGQVLIKLILVALGLGIGAVLAIMIALFSGLWVFSC